MVCYTYLQLSVAWSSFATDNRVNYNVHWRDGYASMSTCFYVLHWQEKHQTALTYYGHDPPACPISQANCNSMLPDRETAKRSKIAGALNSSLTIALDLLPIPQINGSSWNVAYGNSLTEKWSPRKSVLYRRYFCSDVVIFGTSTH